ncbi:MAG: hypothetical protein VX367_02070 [SAR324 cluster bacterium]|nr:hypothetical protein [SAR324 cluster bacterium]
MVFVSVCDDAAAIGIAAAAICMRQETLDFRQQVALLQLPFACGRKPSISVSRRRCCSCHLHVAGNPRFPSAGGVTAAAICMGRESLKSHLQAVLLQLLFACFKKPSISVGRRRCCSCHFHAAGYP